MQSVEERLLATEQTPTTGLSAHDVAVRVGRGQINVSREHTSRSLIEILRANLLTSVILSVAFVFSVGLIRTFYALPLPREVLGATLLIGITGIAFLIAVWQVSQRIARDPSAVVPPSA